MVCVAPARSTEFPRNSLEMSTLPLRKNSNFSDRNACDHFASPFQACTAAPSSSLSISMPGACGPEPKIKPVSQLFLRFSQLFLRFSAPVLTALPVLSTASPLLDSGLCFSACFQSVKRPLENPNETVPKRIL